MKRILHGQRLDLFAQELSGFATSARRAFKLYLLSATTRVWHCAVIRENFHYKVRLLSAVSWLFSQAGRSGIYGRNHRLKRFAQIS